MDVVRRHAEDVESEKRGQQADREGKAAVQERHVCAVPRDWFVCDYIPPTVGEGVAMSFVADGLPVEGITLYPGLVPLRFAQDHRLQVFSSLCY